MKGARTSRREFGKVALAAGAGLLAGPSPSDTLFAQSRGDSRIAGVRIGAITYSFRTMTDPAEIIKAFVTIGLGEMELMSGDAEKLAGALGGRGDTARAWRKAATDATFAPVRQRIADAGIALTVLCYNMNVASTTDEDIEYAFTMARGLGVHTISTSTQVSMAKRLAPFADRHKIMVGFHGHDSTERPDEVSTEATFESVFATGQYLGANLDIGHFMVAGGDSVAFLRRHHARVTNLHLKDKRRDGTNVAWGQGDTPIKDVLQLVKREGWDLPINIEYVHADPAGPVAGVTDCLRYIKAALA